MRKNNKIKWRFNIHLFLIMFASVFMTIGFAAISAVNLSVVGNAVASAQSGVFISDATCNSGGTVLGTAGSVLNSSVTLSSSNSSSTVTCTITFL